MKKVSRTSKKGFTLVELLVVIGIIGLLAAIILPKFTGYTDKAIQKDAVSQARTVYTQMMAYYTEKGKFPADIDGVIAEAAKVGLTVGKAAPTKGTDGGYISAYGTGSTVDGSFTFILMKGDKSYTVTCDANGKIEEPKSAS